MAGLRTANPQAVEKGDDRGGAAGQAPQRFAVARAHRLRAGDAARRQMLHQADEERQIGLVHPLFIERQDELAGFRAQEEVRILDALGYALERGDAAEVVAREERAERFVRDFGIDRHDSSGRVRSMGAARRTPRGVRLVTGRRDVRKRALGGVHAVRLRRADAAQRDAARTDRRARRGRRRAGPLPVRPAFRDRVSRRRAPLDGDGVSAAFARDARLDRLRRPGADRRDLDDAGGDASAQLRRRRRLHQDRGGAGRAVRHGVPRGDADAQS